MTRSASATAGLVAAKTADSGPAGLHWGEKGRQTPTHLSAAVQGRWSQLRLSPPHAPTPEWPVPDLPACPPIPLAVTLDACSALLLVTPDESSAITTILFPFSSASSPAGKERQREKRDWKRHDKEDEALSSSVRSHLIFLLSAVATAAVPALLYFFCMLCLRLATTTNAPGLHSGF